MEMFQSSGAEAGFFRNKYKSRARHAGELNVYDVLGCCIILHTRSRAVGFDILYDDSTRGQEIYIEAKSTIHLKYRHVPSSQHCSSIIVIPGPLFHHPISSTSLPKHSP
jgi:hypothetical protein